MNYFRGYITKIVFRSEESGYTVLSGVMDGDEYTLVGALSMLEQGESIEAEGHESEHSLYGAQFVVESYRQLPPQTEEAIERYLGSGAIKGIGVAMAARIVKRFKADTLRVIEEEPERLAEVKGISERMAMDIATAVAARKDMQDAYIFLQGYGISTTLAARIYETYGSALYQLIRENPYRLAEDIDGMGFKSCDELAARMGIGAQTGFRICAAIQYVLYQAQNNGHSYLPSAVLQQSLAELLGEPVEALENYLLDLQLERKLIIKEEKVYLARLYYTEVQTAGLLHALNFSSQEDESASARLDELSEEAGITLDELQREAALSAVRHGILIITGGPGTGKTTTINTMIRYFSDRGSLVSLAAPTGRAAKRMTEATGCEARTLHRLLEYQGRPGEDGGTQLRFERNENQPLETDVVIVDEMSMVDIFLMNALLKALQPGTRLIMVGDANQLPSVGAGNVLRDLIASGELPVVQLTHIFRQAAQSDIVVNAHKINAGEAVPLGKASKDFLFIRTSGAEAIGRSIRVLLKDKLPGYVDAQALELQVLTPQRKGALGVEQLNRQLQAEMNPPDRNKAEKELFGTLFREGDKVMQMKNDYNLIWETRGQFGLPLEKGEGVFNGDIGLIEEINHFAQTLTVRFEERYVEYSFKQCEHLELAYATTVHKAQGSEYPAVVMPMYQGPQLLMNRNLLYTAVTRARRCVCLVGDPRVFEAMVNNTNEARRYSSLAERIREAFREEGFY